MSARDEVSLFVSEKFTIGLSTIVGVTAIAGQNATVLKYTSGGSLEIGGAHSMVNGATVAFSWGNGYLMGSSEILNVNMSGIFYLAATGATVICHLIRGKTQGA